MRVNVDSRALLDPRFARLGMRCSPAINRHEALGRCIRVWNAAYEARSPIMLCEDVDAHAEVIGFADAMIGSGLAALLDPSDADLLRRAHLRGVKGRIDWLLLQDKKSALGVAKRMAALNHVVLELANKSADDPRDDPFENPGVAHGVVHGDIPITPDQAPDQAPSAHPLAEVAVAEINRLSGARYSADSKETSKNARAIAKAGATPEIVRSVIASKWRAWSGDDRMREHFKPSVLLRPSNFAKYAEDLAARGDRTASHRAAQAPTQIQIDDQIFDVPGAA